MAPAAAAQQQAEGGYSPACGVRLGAPSPSLGTAPVYRWGAADQPTSLAEGPQQHSAQGSWQGGRQC